MPKELTYEFIKEEFEKRGYKLISTEYLGAKKKLTYICCKDHECHTTWTDFKNNHGCKKCHFIKIGNINRHSQEYVENYFRENGCELLSNNYINNKQILEYICVCKNKSTIRFDAFKSGQRCWFCKSKNNSGKNNWVYREDKNQQKIETDFKNKYRLMLVRCKIKKTDKYNYIDENLLGYNRHALLNYIYNHSNWNNVKNKKWAIDHIYPIIAFYHFNIMEPKIIHSLDNLQPITISENLSKSNKYNKEDFIKWLKTKGINVEKI